MQPRWFNIAVLVLWLLTMGWLVTEKVLPPLLIGEPPKYENVIDATANEPGEPVAWDLSINNKPLGWASSQTAARDDGVVELVSQVHLQRFPLAELAPTWLANMLDPDGSGQGEMQVDMLTTVELVANKLRSFHTAVDLGSLKDAIRIQGEVEGSRLQLSVRAGDFVPYSRAHDLPGDTLIGDGLSPRARLARLRVGQTWTEPMYSPFHQPNNPMQILQAKVEYREPLAWNGAVINTVVVVYRNDPGAELNGSRLARGRVWVREDGVVLKQEVQLLGSKLVFTRLPRGQMPERTAQDSSTSLDDATRVVEPAAPALP
jgi:hypothetical protein